jgi:hypothetical protein
MSRSASLKFPDNSLGIASSSQAILSHSNAQLAGELAPILQTISRLKKLNDLLPKIFSKEMAKHCQVANLSQGKLVLSFDNAAWASRFYFEKGEYLSKFRAIPEFAGITQIQHQVNPDLFKAPPKPIPKPQEFKLSLGATESLNQLILKSDGKLKEKLEKLRGRLKN